MPPDRAPGELHASTVIAGLTARRALRSGAVWGVLFGALVLNDALAYRTNFPTLASREEFARTFGHNAALAAIVGPARRLDTVGGELAWRMFGLLLIVGAIWGLLTATRLLRKEEDAGRWELLLAGRTTRRRATVEAMVGLATGWLVLWGLTATFTVIAGSRPTVNLSVSASLFYATAATASAGMFLAIGALACQLAPTRREANGLAAAVFAVSFLVRMVADSVGGLAWMRWASPLGWIESLHPLTGPRPLAFVPIVALTVAAAGLAVALAERRDVGAAVFTRRSAARAQTRLLNNAVLLVVRLERWVALAWVAGLGVLAFIFGVTARAAAGSGSGFNNTVERAVARLGGRHGGIATAWIGYEFLFIAALVAFAAAGQIAAMRGEEGDGHLDNLLARHLDRRAWLTGRLAFAAALVVAVGLAAVVGGWAGVASGTNGVGLAAMLKAGLNLIAPALFILGLGTLIYGIAPRLVAPILYGLVLWSFLIEIIGANITTNRLLLDTALLSNLGPVPAASLNWTAIAWLTGLGGIASAAGLAAFQRRDLAAA